MVFLLQSPEHMHSAELRDSFQYADEAGRLVLNVRATRSKRLLAPAAKRRKTEVAILAGQQLALQCFVLK